MPKAYRLQSNFTKGVLDPTLASRTDVDAFYNGVAVGRNVVPLTQGGLKRRPGLEHIATGNADAQRLIEFEFSVEQRYLICLCAGNFEIYRDDVLVDTVATPYTAGIYNEIRYTQSADTMIFVHPDHQPRRLVRGATDADWTLEVIEFTNIPDFYYNDDKSPPADDEVQRINFGAGINRGDDFQLVLDGTRSDVITYPGSGNADEREDTRNVLEEAFNALPNTPNTGITVTHVTSETYEITFTDEAADAWPLIIVQEVNTGSSVGTVTRQAEGSPAAEPIMSGPFLVENGGSTYKCIASHTSTAADEPGVGVNWTDFWELTTGSGEAWAVDTNYGVRDRGWPRTVTFHEARLWLGGFKELPQTILSSRIADFFNLEVGKGLDDQAILVTLDTDQVNAIQALYSGRQLQVFTAGGEFIAPTVENRPYTPSTIAFRRQTRHGSSELRPVSVDGATMFVERSGKVLRQFIFGIEQDGYSAPALSVLSADLIKQPVSIAVQRGTTSDQANLVFMVNSDGTATVFNLLVDQNIAAFVEWTTDGEFQSVAVLGDDVYFSVKRTRPSDGIDQGGIEKLNADVFLDSATIGTGTTISGLGRMDGATVRVKGDGLILEDEVVTASAVTVDESYDTLEIGLDYDVTITTMPLNIDFGNGPTLTRKKRFIEATVDVFETLGLVVDGRRVPDRHYDQDLLDSAPEPFTGIKQLYVHGWTDLAQITITQPDPLPMTIRGLTLEVSLT